MPTSARPVFGAFLLGALTIAACSTHGGVSFRSAAPPAHSASIGSSAAASAPRPAHVVVVVEENHSANQILGSAQAPYLNSLARAGLDLTDMHAITHPSEPNYLALFSGSTHRVSSDACPLRLRGRTLAGELRAAGLSFRGYAESLPSAGFAGCSAGEYARKHAPWTDFGALPRSLGQPFSAFPADFARLPTVSFVVPNLMHDMHDGTVRQGDTWLRTHLGAYVHWAKRHDSVLIVTWDENDGAAGNRIASILVGAGIPARHDGQHLTHYSLLRSIEDVYGLPAIGAARHATPIRAWRAG